MRALVSSVLFASLVLAGCSGASDDGSSTPGAGAGGQATVGGPGGGGGSATVGPTPGNPGTSSETQGPSGPAGANHPPAGTLAADNPGGSLPLNITFTMTASDQDNDALSWALDANGDGTPEGSEAAPATFPATFRVTYTTAGTFNVTYTLSDGKDETTYNTVITAGGAAPSVQFTGHVDIPDPNENTEGECLFALLTRLGGPDDVAGNEFQLTNNYDGWSFAFDVDGMVAQFEDEAGYVGDKAASGTVPEGSVAVLACSHMAVDTDYTLTLTGA